MKTNISNVLVKLMWIGILGAAGCSLPISASMPSSATVPTEPILTSLPKTDTLSSFRGKIAFIGLDKIRDDNQIYVMSADGGGLKNITPPNLPSIFSPDWSPDGMYIVFEAFDAATGTHQIFKMKSDGSNLQQLTFGEHMAGAPSWSPDGESIIFESSGTDISGVAQIYIIKPDGTGMRRLGVEKGDNTTMIGFYRRDGLISVSVPITRHSYNNYVINSDGLVQQQFREFVTEVPPVWSPDGEFVVLATIRTDCSGLIVMRYDGSERICLHIDRMVTPPMYVSAASWSPDGKFIIFSSNLDGDWDIYVIKPDGSELIQLTNLPGDETFPIWSVVP